MITAIEAGLKYDPFGGRVSIRLYGRPHNWSLAAPPEEIHEVRSRIASVARELNAEDVYAPRPSTFNAQVCDPEALTETQRLSRAVVLLRGCDADGVVVPPRAAFYLGSADCITIVLHNPEDGKTVAAHGGRDCLLDKDRLAGKQPRQFDSVVDAMMARFPKSAARHIRAFLTCGVGPEQFGHSLSDEKYGKTNTLMMGEIVNRWGSACLEGNVLECKICLSELVRAQLIKHKVRTHHIGYDAVDTFTDKDASGEYRWWSHRRGDGLQRNAVFVVRNW